MSNILIIKHGSLGDLIQLLRPGGHLRKYCSLLRVSSFTKYKKKKCSIDI